MTEGFLAAIVTGCFTLIPILIQNRRLKRVNAHVEETRHEVKNSHKTNLRDDLDLMHSDIKAIAEVQRAQGADIIGIRTDLRLERQERIELGNRVTALEGM